MATIRDAAATCHPDRPVHARGLCQRCYNTSYRATHPRRTTIVETTAEETLRRILSDTAIEVATGLPPAITGVIQHCFTTWPETCPKCHRSVSLVVEGRREAHCRGVLGGCGWTGYLTSTAATGRDAVATPRPGGYMARSSSAEIHA